MKDRELRRRVDELEEVLRNVQDLLADVVGEEEKDAEDEPEAEAPEEEGEDVPRDE